MNNNTSARCPARYERPGGADRGDRIVACHLAAGHPGEHEEAGTEVTWLDEAHANGHPNGFSAELEAVLAGLEPEQEIRARALEYASTLGAGLEAVTGDLREWVIETAEEFAAFIANGEVKARSITNG